MMFAKNFNKYCMIVMFLFMLFSANALQFNVEPKTVYNLPVMITLTIYNDDDKTYDLSIDSYILVGGSEKFFTTTNFELAPFKTKTLHRYIPKMDLKNAVLVWKVYGDYNKIIKVNIITSSLQQEPVSNENKAGLESEESSAESDASNNAPNKAELCKGIVYLFSPTRGVSEIFNSDEKILLNIDYNDEVKSIISDWDIKQVSDSVYELTFLSKTKPYYNEIEIEFENCGKKQLKFYIKNEKNNQLLYITVVLILVVIFVAFYSELAYLDRKKTHERIQRQLKRKEQIKLKSSKSTKSKQSKKRKTKKKTKRK